jgi:transposase
MTIPTSAELRRKYQEMTQRELAAFFGTTLHEVRKWFKTYGIKASRVAEAEKPAPATLSEYYSKGMSQRQLAQHFGVSYATMRKWFSEVSLKASRSANHNKGGAPNPNKSPYQLELRVCPKNPAANQFPDVFRASLATRHRQKPIFPIRQGAGGHF